MAQTYATEVSGLYSTPATQANGNVVGGRMRRYRATITLASQADGDTVVLAKVPAGSVFAYGVINASATLGASATVAIGISGAAGKYRTAAVFTAAAPTLFGNVAAVDDSALTAEEEVILTVGTAALPSSGTCVVDLYFSGV
jgi:hypothetical protein